MLLGCDLRVGQRVWVKESIRSSPSWYRGEVVKTGRRLVTIATVWEHNGTESLGRELVFRLESQTLNDKNYGSRTRFLTDEQREQEDHEAEIEAFIHRVGIDFKMSSRFPFEHKEKLVEFLKGLGYGA